MLFIDMICVQWRHAGKHGRIVVRGTDQVFLFESCLVPAIPGTRSSSLVVVSPSKFDCTTPLYEPDSGVSFYYHTQQCGGVDEYQHAYSGEKAERLSQKPAYAISMGIDVKQHPRVTILYREIFSEHESSIGTVDITYNTLLFKKGVFVDSIMKSQGYGIVLLCHTLHDDPSQEAKTKQLVNWRQCRCLLRQYIRALACKTAPETTTAEVMQRQHSTSALRQIKNGAIPTDLVERSNSSESTLHDRQWDTSLYQSLKQTMSSTFNILM